MVQAQFIKKKPGPARLELWRTDGENWFEEIIEDADSSVFHKAMVWRDGLLTIAAGALPSDPPKEAKLSHWTRDGEGWKEQVLWKRAWSGRFQRLRDIGIGDFDGDGADEFAIATHDRGVVAVADEVDGAWTVVELDELADTFVHEIEVGDVDGDGVVEFYATPSERNKASGASQPGGVVRYVLKDGSYVRSEVVSWDISHAKEILVADTDGDGADELYAVREAHIEAKEDENGKKVKTRVSPVQIIRLDHEAGAWTETVVASLEDDQCRFLVAADANHDGKTDLVAAGYKSGLWMLERDDEGGFGKATLIDRNSGGFEHATHAADLDGDGKVEIYVAADQQREFRVYTWDGSGFARKKIASIATGRITWNLQDGLL
jgi:hypothetical protein